MLLTPASIPVEVDRDWRLLIAGELVPAASGRRLDVVNPATGRQIASAPAAGIADVDRVVEAAALAFRAWRRTPAAEWARLVGLLADSIEAHRQRVAAVLTLHHRHPVQAKPGAHR